MKKIGFVIAVAALAATAMPFQARQAQAYCRGCAVGAGIIGGLAAGAIIGSAIANSAQASAGEPVYAVPPPPPQGVAPADVDPNEAYDSAACHVERQPVRTEYGMTRWENVEVCD
jgi:hypothetical protein